MRLECWSSEFSLCFIKSRIKAFLALKLCRKSGTNTATLAGDTIDKRTNPPLSKSIKRPGSKIKFTNSFQHLTVLTVNNNNNNMFQHVTDTNREHYQGKRIGEFDFGSRPLDRFTEWRICPLVNCVKSGSFVPLFLQSFNARNAFILLLMKHRENSDDQHSNLTSWSLRRKLAVT